jgi:hypothetical protein
MFLKNIRVGRQLMLIIIIIIELLRFKVHDIFGETPRRQLMLLFRVACNEVIHKVLSARKNKVKMNK